MRNEKGSTDGTQSCVGRRWFYSVYFTRYICITQRVEGILVDVDTGVSTVHFNEQAPYLVFQEVDTSKRSENPTVVLLHHPLGV